MNSAPSVKFSVVIGLVSSVDRHRILDCLHALSEQEGEHDYEVIIADRRNDEVSREIHVRFPEVMLISCRSGTSLPQLLTLALQKACGKFLLVTEDHCLPASDWFKSIEKTFLRAPSNTVAVGGCIENGLRQNSLDWATFFCEYSSFLSPVEEGLVRKLPGFNIAYKRTELADIDPQQLSSGFWEIVLFPLLLQRGFVFYSSNEIRLNHVKSFSLHLFLRQRFTYSRYYAGQRFAQTLWVIRLAAAAACILLPFLLLWRISRSVLGKRCLYTELLLATPYLILFVLIWALGEFWGYLFGAEDALAAVE